MANNVTITAGSGTTVAADEETVNGALAEVQYVTPRTPRKLVQVVPTISTSPAYTSGDCLGGLMSIAAAARISGAGGVIEGIQVVDKTQAQRSAMTLFFYSQSITVAGDNAAFATSDADQLFFVGQVEILSTNYNTAFPGTPLNSVASVPHNDAATSPNSMRIPYICAATTLFCQAVVRGTPTYTTTTDLAFNFNLVRD